MRDARWDHGDLIALEHDLLVDEFKAAASAQADDKIGRKMIVHPRMLLDVITQLGNAQLETRLVGEFQQMDHHLPASFGGIVAERTEWGSSVHDLRYVQIIEVK